MIGQLRGTDVSNWKKIGDKFVGNSKGTWVEHPCTKVEYLFKEANDKECFAENFAYDLAVYTRMKNAEYQKAIHNDETGVLTENFLKGDERFISGEIMLEDSGYVINRSQGISLEKIIECMDKYDMTLGFVKTFIEKALIGDFDIENPKNWGIISNLNGDKVRMAPNFDNSISLGSDLMEMDFKIFKKDPSAYQRYMNRDLGITIDGEFSTYFEVLDYMTTRYYGEVKRNMKNINDNITDERIERRLDTYCQDGTISPQYKEFLMDYIPDRISIMNSIVKDFETNMDIKQEKSEEVDIEL